MYLKRLVLLIVCVFLTLCKCEKTKCKYVNRDQTQASRTVIVSSTTQETRGALTKEAYNDVTTSVVKTEAITKTEKHLTETLTDEYLARGQKDTTEDFSAVTTPVESSCGLELKPYHGKSK